MKEMSMKGKWGDGKYVLLNDDSYVWACQWKWHVDRRGYAIRNVWIDVDGVRKCVTIQMHSLINSTPKGFHTDHINGNRLDNRRENLRTVTPLENSRNAGKKSDKKKYKGVHPTANGRWTVNTHIHYINGYWGTYDSEEVAARVYDYVVFSIAGKYAKLNFPDSVPSEEFNPENIRTYRYSHE